MGLLRIPLGVESVARLLVAIETRYPVVLFGTCQKCAVVERLEVRSHTTKGAMRRRRLKSPAYAGCGE